MRRLVLVAIVGAAELAAADPAPPPLAPPPSPAPPADPDPDLDHRAAQPAPDARTAPGLPSPSRARAVTVGLRYRRATDFDGGVVELAVRRPLVTRWWAEAAIGLQLGATAGRQAITLTSPRLGVGLVVGPHLVATADLGLPAVSATGDGGALATAHTALAAVDPALLAPRTTSLGASLSPRHAIGKAFVQARVAATFLVPTDGANQLLLHADVGGGIAVAGPVHLAATLATTSYQFADPTGDDTFVHRVTLAALFRTRGVGVIAGVAAPLDRSLRQRDLVDLTVTARATF